MMNLTSIQLAILASACNRADGRVVRPPKMRPAAASKVAGILVEQGLVREVRAKAEAPVWREDEAGKTFCLAISKAGRAIVASAMGRSAPDPACAAGSSSASRAASELPQQGATEPGRGKPGSKRALLLTLFERADGASINELMGATGWLPHTTRTALSGLRKAGLTIERSRLAGQQGSVYRAIRTADAEAV